MVHSGHTNCTQLSPETTTKELQIIIPISVKKRSIGIQLSRQSTPRCVSRINNNNMRMRRNEADSSIEDEDEEDEFEYDYYDYTTNEFGLLNKPQKFEFVSQIDIDQIVYKEIRDLIPESDIYIQKHDAHTQI